MNRTWGKKCDYLLFITSEDSPGLPTVKVNLGGPESRGLLWTKTRHAWLYVPHACDSNTLLLPVHCLIAYSSSHDPGLV